MQIRLQKAIADYGICSRRKAESLIQAGKVRVNGKAVSQMGIKVDPKIDEIEVLGKIYRSQKKEKVYYLFYKPKNVVSTLSDPQDRPSLVEYTKKLKTRVYPIGRLDFASEGLMILTNDGKLTQKISHPSGGIHKTYHVTVDQDVSLNVLENLKAGAMIDGKETKPVEVKRHPKKFNLLQFVLQDGRRREIRVMCENEGLKVTRLVRIAIGKIEIRNLRPGEFKQVDSEMILSLF